MLLEAVPDAAFVVDGSGRIVAANAECEPLFGRPRDTLVGIAVETLLPADFRGGGEMWAIGRDGRRRFVDVRVKALAHADASVVAIRDAGERAARDDQRSEFLAGMGHDLRTPLNAIIGFSELLQDGRLGPLTPQQHEFLGDVVVSARHLLRLVNDVVDVAKMDVGRVDFQPEPVSLRAVVEEIRDLVRASVVRKRATLVADVEAAPAGLVLDPARLRQMLYHLVSQALKLAPEDTCVTVRARPAGERALRLEVEDAGPVRPWGPQLGLSLARRLAEAQGGRVGAEARDALNVFFVVLPLRAGAPA